MSGSVTLSIATNSAITLAKGFGFFVTASPTLFAETIHSVADVGNQVLLKVGEIRGRGGPDRHHPFGRGQEKFFWALVSAVSVFFVGCAVNVYHGIHSLLEPESVEPFTRLVFGLLVFSLALETWTFIVAYREIGGWKGVRDNRHNVTVLAVLLEDAVALIGILLTLLVGSVSLLLGPSPVFDAIVAIVVGVMLGAMALFLAGINRRILIDVTHADIDHEAERWLAHKDIRAHVHSLLLDDDVAIIFVHAHHDVPQSYIVGNALKARMESALRMRIRSVYWKFSVPV
jgi:solute carrier family 30 (zinc transporter), member 9